MSDPFDDNVCSKSEERAIVQAATEAGLRTTIKVLTAELAAAKAEVESWNAQHERMNAAWAGKVERLKLDLSRHKRALELALYYVEGDATYEGVKEKVSRILEGEGR